MRLLAPRLESCTALMLATLVVAAGAEPTGTGFTYQGQLKQQGAPLEGAVDLRVALFDVEVSGVPLDELFIADVAVANGLFTVELDFGVTVFNGDTRWLEIAVRSPHDPTDTEPYTILTPRQLMTATPYALQTRGLFVDDAGKVGIGTESPTSALHVETNGLRAIYANNTLSFGYGIQGLVSSSTGRNYGVYGESMSDEGYGVYGQASAETGSAPGVYGYSNSPTGRGVFGFVGPTGGVNYGVYGHSNSTQGHGVYGLHGINSGPGIGVKGRTASPDGYAGYFEGGRNYFEGNVGIGTESPYYPLDVHGGGSRTISATHSGTSGSAVIGWASAATGTANAGRFETDSVSGYAVRAVATATTGTNYGVYGESKSPNGYAGYFTGDRSCFVNGNVGIGTAEPAYRLHVELTGDRAIYARNNSSFGAAVYGHASRTDGTNHAIHGEANSPDAYAGYFAGGKNYFEGDVGIGTDSPEYPLHVETSGYTAIWGEAHGTVGSGVHGVARDPDATLASGVKGDAYGPTASGVLGVAVSNTGINHGVYGLTFSTEGYGVRGKSVSATGYAGHFEGGRNYFEGDVGIGTESSSNETKLHVQARDNDFGILVDAIGTPGSEIGLHAGASGYSSVVKNAFYSSGIWSRFDETQGAFLQEIEPDGDVRLDVAAAGTGTIGWNTALFLSGAGKVGLGTNSPQEKLHLGGANANLLLRENGGNPYVEIGDTSLQRGYLQWLSASNRLLLYASGHAYPVAIGPTATGGLFVDTEANGGEVGIGTESPSFKLHVNGSAGKPGGGSWSSTSDRRLKQNIRGLDDSLDRLMQLRGVTFEYKNPEAINELPGERIGMVAQEVETVFPDWVSEGSHGYKRVTYRGFEALTVEALREIREEKDREMREKDLRIEALQDEVEGLQQRLAKLENLLSTEIVGSRSRD